MSSRTPDANDPREHFVYRLYDGDDLLYIGCTEDVDARLRLHHVAAKDGTCLWERHPNKAAARQAEREAIAAEAPLLNKQHNPTRFKKVGTNFVPVEPIHPRTQAMLDDERPATMDEMREALEKVAAMLELDAWAVSS